MREVNLYEYIVNMLALKDKLSAKAKELLPIAKNGTEEDKSAYAKVLIKLRDVKESLCKVEQAYPIGLDKMSKIISKATGKEYTPKIFKEVVHKDGKVQCTYSFAACFVSESNVHSINPNEHILLIPPAYHQMLDDIDAGNGIIQFSGSEMLEWGQVYINLLYENTNFIKMFTSPNEDTEVNKSFEKWAKPILSKYLKTLNVVSMGEDLEHKC